MIVSATGGFETSVAGEGGGREKIWDELLREYGIGDRVSWDGGDII